MTVHDVYHDDYGGDTCEYARQPLVMWEVRLPDPGDRILLHFRTQGRVLRAGTLLKTRISLISVKSNLKQGPL